MLVDRKPLAPSLLNDPAFSTNPHAHPFAVTSHDPWLSSPPAGHPTLKRRSSRRPPADDAPSDSEPRHIIPPPNSPVSFADGPPHSTSFAVPNDVLNTASSPEPHTSSPTTAAEPSQSLSNFEKSHQVPGLSPAPPPPTTRPPATPRRRITLMTILKRRSSQQPQPLNPKPRKPLTSSKSLSNKNDVTRPDTKPNPSQLFPPRPATLTTSEPATAPMLPTTHPTQKRRLTDIPVIRPENLDRIDELDETNPWGIGFHHGGPYEAAAKAIRGKEKTVFPGYGSYNRGVPQPSDNDYCPPQATGLSLNLSPGQVLPRNYQQHYTTPLHQGHNPPAPTAVMMIPPASVQATYPQSRPSRVPPLIQSSATLPVSSRRQSYQVFTNQPREPLARRQSFNPTPTASQPNLHTPSPLSSSITLPQPYRIPSAASAPVINSQPVPASMPVETRHNSPNRVTEDPLSPVNLVSIGIGMAMLDNGSDEDEESEGSSSSAPSQPSTNLDGTKRPHSKVTVLRKSSPERAQHVTASPEGTSSSVSLPTQPRKLEEVPLESPPPYSSSTKEIQFKELGYQQTSVPSQPSSTSSSSIRMTPLHANSQLAFTSTQAPSAQNHTVFRSDIPQGYPPSRKSPERVGFEDSGSVHPSLSSKSSSSRSSGPPSSRRLPKHLVMPTPLAQSSVGSRPYQNRPPLTQLPPHRPTHQSLPHLVPHQALAPLSLEPIPSAQIFVKGQAQEIHFASSKAGKLKKRVSLMGAASPMGDAPVVTTVSFAPPIIGFNNSVAREDDFGPVMTEKFIQKRVLSKRKSNW